MTKPFHKTIGIVGGGQLGKMLIESSHGWNVPFAILDPSDPAPAAKYVKDAIVGSLTDKSKILELAEISDLMTFEIEHIDVDTLIELRNKGKKVIPDPDILKTIQDKGLQKEHYANQGLPTAPYQLVADKDEAIAALGDWEGEKVVIKSRKGGYDGKGVHIAKVADLVNGTEAYPFEGGCVLEAFVPQAVELSVIVARSADGNMVTYPVAEMVFDPKINLVDYLFAPANIADSVRDEAVQVARKAIDTLGGIGLFAVELFLDEAGDIFINEIAPRPHNSGHHTIEASYCSQYEQLLRILLDLPLGSTELKKPAVMVNIIGPEGFAGEYDLKGVDRLLSVEGAYLHMYNKTQTKPGRKMGHYTVLADSVDEAIQKAESLRGVVEIVPQD